MLLLVAVAAFFLGGYVGEEIATEAELKMIQTELNNSQKGKE